MQASSHPYISPFSRVGQPASSLYVVGPDLAAVALAAQGISRWRLSIEIRARKIFETIEKEADGQAPADVLVRGAVLLPGIWPRRDRRVETRAHFAWWRNADGHYLLTRGSGGRQGWTRRRSQIRPGRSPHLCADAGLPICRPPRAAQRDCNRMTQCLRTLVRHLDEVPNVSDVVRHLV
jgi:hypothetical protein